MRAAIASSVASATTWFASKRSSCFAICPRPSFSSAQRSERVVHMRATSTQGAGVTRRTMSTSPSRAQRPLRPRARTRGEVGAPQPTEWARSDGCQRRSTTLTEGATQRRGRDCVAPTVQCSLASRAARFLPPPSAVLARASRAGAEDLRASIRGARCARRGGRRRLPSCWCLFVIFVRELSTLASSAGSRPSFAGGEQT